MGLISLVALMEAQYNSGFAYNFWAAIDDPIGIFLGLIGYCTYRYRETRSMTMGQFLEMRYSRPFRIFAGTLQSIAGVINYAIFPAVSARFLIYYCGLPVRVSALGLTIPTFQILMLLLLGLALFITTRGGQLTIMVTDCVQGLLSYPMYLIVVIAIFVKFSWFRDIAPTLLDRPPGESMLNPFDIHRLRNFNLFYVFVGMFSGILNRMAWQGNTGYQSCALNAHEQKMGAVIGTWRNGFSGMMYVLLAVSAYTLLNNPRFESQAVQVRHELAWKALQDVAPNTVAAAADAMPSADEVRARLAALETESPALYKKVSTIQTQMRVPLALRHILPVGVLGVFCAIGVFLCVSTDTTYLHSWGSIIVQDIILPLRGRAFAPEVQLRLLRRIITGVAVFAFLFSSYFSQMDFILMFFSITGAIWLGGAGSCIVGGLYWKRGTTAGAWSALLCGSTLATSGIILQQLWPRTIYPWLAATGRLAAASRFVERLSAPFEPILLWRVNPTTFPINSREWTFFTMLISLTLYIVVSRLTCRTPFNMDRLLHRGIYHREGVRHEALPWTWRNVFSKLIGINSQYTRGDRILARAVFAWSFGYAYLINFVTVAVWNLVFGRWPNHWWANWFFIRGFIISGIVASISTVWFTIGGTLDLRRMFRRLAARDENELSALDDGRVVGHVSAEDAERFKEPAGPDVPETKE